MLNRTAADVTEKKKKGKPSKGRLWLLLFLALFLLFACVVITVLAISGPMINGQIRQTSLPDKYLQSATTLLNTSRSIVIDSQNITIELWDVNRDYQGDAIICVGVRLNDSPYPEALEQYDDSTLFVNGSRVTGATIYQGVDKLSPGRRWCGYGELEEGVHLIEFELRDAMFGEPTYTHQWAIEIEAD